MDGAYVHNNPINHVDPAGLWAEDLALGIPSLAIGAHSLWQNIKAGRAGAAVLDAVGILADGAAIVAPGVPGGVGLGIKGARAAQARKALQAADRAINTVQAAEGAIESAQQGDGLGVAKGAVQAGLGAKGMVPGGKLGAAADDGADAVRAARNRAQDHAEGGLYRGGPHSATKGPKGDGLESHHMPDRHASPAVPADKGPAIQMDKPDHQATSSWGGGIDAQQWRKQTAEMIANGEYRKAMAREIRDVRRAADEVSGDRTKYNQATREMLDYSRSSKQLPEKHE